MTRWMMACWLGLAACGGEPDDDDDDDDDGVGDARVDAILALTGDTANGATLYADNCALCHGDDGEGGVGGQLEGEVSAAEESEIVLIILDGEGTMPAWEDYFSEQEVADVTAYLLDTFGG